MYTYIKKTVFFPNAYIKTTSFYSPKMGGYLIYKLGVKYRSLFRKKTNFLNRVLTVGVVVFVLLTTMSAISLPQAAADGARATSTLTVTSGSDSGVGSLRDVLATANDGDTIIFDRVTEVMLTAEISFDKKNIAINGVAGVSIVGDACRLLNSTAGTGTLTLKGLTMHGGDAAGNGGGVYALSSIRAINCTFAGNAAAGNGGGVYAERDVALEDCTFAGNAAVGNGGGAYAGRDAALTNCIFTNNAAAGNGGGVYAEHNVILKDSGFAKSTSADGTVYSGSGWIEAGNASFFANSVSGSSTGIADASAGISLSHCTFTNNAGGTYAYNAYVRDGGPLTAENCLMTQDGMAGNGYPAISGDSQLGTGGAAGYNNWFGDNTLVYNYIMPLPGVVGNAPNMISGLEADAAGNQRTGGSCLYGAVNWTAMSWAVTSGNSTGPDSINDAVVLAKAVYNNASLPAKPDKYVVYFGETFATGGTVTLTSAIGFNGDMMYIGRLSSDGGPDVTIKGGGTNSRLFICANSDSTLYLYGLKITKGNYTFTAGGAVHSSGSLVVQHCVFTDNLGGNGGAIGTTAVLRPSVLINCIFENNTANNSGGGVYFNGVATLKGCVFINNTAKVGDGGGLCASYTSTIVDCVFIGNKSAGSWGGGGMYALKNTDLSGCVFTGNSGSGSVPGYDGGGGLFTMATATLADCVFIENTASSGHGGGAYVSGGNTFAGCVLTDCTFVNNAALTGTGGGVYVPSNAVIENCIFAGNSGKSAGAVYAGSALVANSTVYGNTTSDTASCAVESKFDAYCFHITIASNTGGGIRAATAGYPAYVYNSIVSGNTETDGTTPSQIKGYVSNVSSLIEGQGGVTHGQIFGQNTFDPLIGANKVKEDGIAVGAAKIAVADLGALDPALHQTVLSMLQKDQLGTLRDSLVTYGSVEAFPEEIVTTMNIAAAPAGGSVYGKEVTVTATLSATPPGIGLEGLTIAFLIDGTMAGAVLCDAAGVAVFNTSALPVGSMLITAEFAGGGGLEGCSDLLTYNVAKADTAASIASDNNPSMPDDLIVFTAAVAAAPPGAGTPTGTVEFYDGAVLMGTAQLNNGTATLSTSALSAGTHAVATKYLGDGNFNTSDSSMDQNVDQNSPPLTYHIAAASDGGSSISPEGTVAVSAGDDATFVFSASHGYHIVAVYADGAEVSAIDLGLGEYTFYNINGDHTISVVSNADDAPGNNGSTGGGGSTSGGDANGGGGDDNGNKVDGSREGAWAVLNMICVVLAVFIGAAAIAAGNDRFKTDGEKKRSKPATALRIIALAIGVASVVLFFTTEDLGLPAAAVDDWTLLTFILFLATLIAAAVSFRLDKESEDKEA